MKSVVRLIAVFLLLYSVSSDGSAEDAANKG